MQAKSKYNANVMTTEYREPKVMVEVKEPKVTAEPVKVTSHVSNDIGRQKEFSDEFVKDLHAYHNDPTKEKKFAEVRAACEFLFKVVAENCPQCADRTTALQTVRLVRMWANSAIALDKSV